MENLLGAIAFFVLIAGQVATVVAVHRMRLDDAAPRESRTEIAAEPQTQHSQLSAA